MSTEHTHEVVELAARAVTHGPKHHFFGYYDMLQWDATGRYMLGLETTFMDRSPEPEDPAVIGLIDTEDDCRWEPVAETYAWNWQQSTRLQWLASAPEREIIYNDRTEDGLVAVILDVQSREKRTLPHPVNIVTHDGSQALTLNFARVHQYRPGYGYPGLNDPSVHEPAPADDGVFWMDMRTGESRLLVSFEQLLELQPRADFAGAPHWVNHIEISPDDKRCSFLHRWHTVDDKWGHRLITANLDGSDIYLLNDHMHFSHYDWRDGSHILAWANHPLAGQAFYVFTDHTQEATSAGKMMPDRDGHCSYSPDRRWVLNDTYPDADKMRTLMLYEVATDRRIDIGRFRSHSPSLAELRCDLHPRWNRDGSQVCFDSVHEGSRQIYVVDVEAVVSG